MASDPSTAAETSARRRIEELRARIREADHAYYVLDRPALTDAQYDALYRELVAIEEAHPELDDPTSPSRRVPGAIADGFRPVAHPAPMLSIESVATEEEFREWVASVDRYLKSDAPRRHSVEPKIDGVSLELLYEAGVLRTASTRGDGFVGEDVTGNVRTIRSVPTRLREAVPGTIAVRGEAYIRKDDFDRLNRRLEEEGEEAFANPRNLCAGSLRQLDPGVPAGRPIRFLAYSVADAAPTGRAGQADLLAWLAEHGLPTVPEVVDATGTEAVVEAYRALLERRDALPYEADGVVVKVDAFDLRERLGTRIRSPRWAVAWKFPPQRAETRVERVVWTVGRTGVVTPGAHLEPVHLAGVTISRASLHNADEVERLGVREGDRVVVERAGDVIPRIVAVVETARRGDERVVEVPTRCPECGTTLVRDEGKVAIRCPNDACPTQVVRHLQHFAGRLAMDIRGIGEKQAAQLLRAGLVHNAADLFHLRREDLETLERWGARSAQNLLDQIEAARRRPLDRLLLALGIREVGERGAKVLARAFGTLEALERATADDLLALDEVGEVMARAVTDWFAEQRNRKLIDRLREGDVAPTPIEAPRAGVFQGMTVVFTGSLETLSRDEAKALVEAQGGRAGSSISSRTHVVVAGPSAGSKLAKAKDLGIEVIDEAEFLRRARPARG